MSELVNEIVFIYVLAILIGASAGVLLDMPSAVILSGVLATLWLIPAFLKLRALTEGYSNCDAGASVTRKASDNGLPSSMEPIGASRLGHSASGTEPFASGPAGPDPDANQIGTDGTPATLSFQSGTSECVKNPFHNVLLDEIKYAPTRPAAPDITTPEAKVALDDFFRVQWFSDPTDVFGKKQSQREFVSQPVTTIPNDQESYQNWLYKIPGKTCKEGNPEMCYGGTNGAALPWLNL